MTIKNISHKIVKIFPQEVNINWTLPYQLEPPSISMGSGFFINTNGFIITAAHVIDQAASVFVQIPAEGDKRFKAEIYGFCPNLDIALLKIVGYKNKYFCKISNTVKVNPGDNVYAVGFPLGQSNIKITKGVVSGRQYGMLQTDTPINPGNSGGPLFKDNYVIGINSMIITLSNNIGYAVPISHFFLVDKELYEKKSILVRRPFIGFEYNETTDSTIKLTKSKCKQGIYISKVFKDSPAYLSGLRNGNILCSIKNNKIDNNGLTNIIWYGEKMSVTDIFSTIKNNEKIPIEFWNGDKLIKSRLDFFNFDLPISMKFPLYENIEYTSFAGLIVMNLSLNHLSKIKLLEEYADPQKRIEEKVLITYVFSGTTIRNIDIFSAGNFITHVNGIKVKNIGQYNKALKTPIKVNGEYVITLQNEYDKLIALSLQETLKNEKHIIETFRYPPSIPLQFLLKKFKNM